MGIKSIQNVLIKSKKYQWVIALIPSLILLIVFFLIPLLNLTRIAFYKYDRFEVYIAEFTFENLTKFFSDPYYWSMISNSLKVGFFTTLVVLVFGYPVAYYVSRSKGWERTLLGAGFMVGLFVTILVSTLGWFIIFLPFGLIQKSLEALGLMHGPLHLLHTTPALVAVLAHLHVAYAILILISAIQNIPKEKIDAARILGAPTWKIFYRIILPLSMPGIVSSTVLVFTLSISSYLVPVLITGQSVRVLPLGIWSYTSQLLNWPFASVIALILLAITFVLTYGFIVFTNKLTRRGEWEMV